MCGQPWLLGYRGGQDSSEGSKGESEVSGELRRGAISAWDKAAPTEGLKAGRDSPPEPRAREGIGVQGWSVCLQGNWKYLQRSHGGGNSIMHADWTRRNLEVEVGETGGWFGLCEGLRQVSLPLGYVSKPWPVS